MRPGGSIRRRLFYQLAGVAAILSLAFFVIVRGVAERAAEGTQDDILAASAVSIADSLYSEGGQITLDLPYAALSMLGTVGQDRVFYHVTAGGESLTGYHDLPAPRTLPRPGTPIFSTHDYRGAEIRAVSVMRPVGAGAQSTEVVVTVAQTRQGLEAISRRITSIAMGVGAGFFLLATALSLWAASTALAPIDRLTGSVTRRGPKDLRPVVADTPAELLPLVQALNSFMSRLRASLMRTEDFIAEAAHRVRTPLATVRAQAEVTHHKLNKPEHRQAIREMIRAIDESSRSAGQMLDHAMVTFRTDSLARDDLDLGQLLEETCARLEPTAELKDILLLRRLPDRPVPFQGDGILLQAAFLNILDNAIKYSPEDSRVEVSLSPGSPIRVEICDQGRGFGEADLAQVTERYARGGNVGGVVGSGLGLTIARDVIRAHGGTLEITNNRKGPGACVFVSLPH